MDIDFECTICGGCCRDLKLPLTVAEAIAWLNDGRDVQVLCEAIPWRDEPPQDDKRAGYKRERSFAAMSGSLTARILPLLVAPFPGACPNLQADNRCAIYAQRPLVCRIYPAEINPFLELQPEHKACPSDAWTPGRPALQRRGVLVDARLQTLIESARASAVADVPVKAAACAALGLAAASLANEGYVVYTPERAALLAALLAGEAQAEHGAAPPPTHWRFVSNRRATVDALTEIGATSALVDAQPAALEFEYLGFYPAA